MSLKLTIISVHITMLCSTTWNVLNIFIVPFNYLKIYFFMMNNFMMMTKVAI